MQNHINAYFFNDKLIKVGMPKDLTLETMQGLINCSCVSIFNHKLATGEIVSIVVDDTALFSSGIKKLITLNNGAQIIGDFMIIGLPDEEGETQSLDIQITKKQIIQKIQLVEV